MAELGEIKRGNEVGYKTTSLIIFHACVLCGKERWVPYVGGLPRQTMCSPCAVHSPEVRKKMSDSHDGLTLSDITKQRISVSIKKLAKFRKVKRRLEWDIKEYMRLCPALGKPDEEMVTEWAVEIYHYKDAHNGWIRDLIEKATKGLDVSRNVRKSSFELYGGEETHIPQNKLGDFIPSEMVGIID